jgi:hypothetical protein
MSVSRRDALAISKHRRLSETASILGLGKCIVIHEFSKERRCRHGRPDPDPFKFLLFRLRSRSSPVYPGFLYDADIATTGFVPGLLAMGKNGIFGPYPTATVIDVDKESLQANDPLVEPH